MIWKRSLRRRDLKCPCGRTTGSILKQPKTMRSYSLPPCGGGFWRGVSRKGGARGYPPLRLSPSRGERAQRARSRTCSFNCQRATDTASHSRRAVRASFARNFLQPSSRGRRECRVLDAPAASRGIKNKPHEHSHHGHTGKTPGIPRAMVLTVSFVLSPVTGLFCYRRRRKSSFRRLDTKRRGVRTTRLRRPPACAYRLERRRRPPHPAPR